MGDVSAGQGDSLAASLDVVSPRRVAPVRCRPRVGRGAAARLGGSGPWGRDAVRGLGLCRDAPSFALGFFCFATRAAELGVPSSGLCGSSIFPCAQSAELCGWSPELCRCKAFCFARKDQGFAHEAFFFARKARSFACKARSSKHGARSFAREAFLFARESRSFVGRGGAALGQLVGGRARADGSPAGWLGSPGWSVGWDRQEVRLF